MNLARQCLIIFTRYPIPGKAKTRLIPALGAEGAANLHARMSEYTLAQAREFCCDDFSSIEVHYADESIDSLMADWLGDDLVYHSQGTGDLGNRMARSIDLTFQSGHNQVIIIGTDCPRLDAGLIKSAFEQLLNCDLILGPAIDGGYYLIGLRRFIPELFVGINWSTEQVLAQTVEIANRLGLSIVYLPWLTDVDRPEDL